MAYQFYCPAGHLLEAEPQYAGQQVRCPTCGAAMLIPAPPAGHAAPGHLPAYQGGYQQPGYPQTQYQQPQHPQAQYQRPAYPQPGYPQPGYQQPGYQQPGYQQPAPGGWQGQPAYEAPATYEQPAEEPEPSEQPAEEFVGLRIGPGIRGGGEEEAPQVGDSAKDDPERILHIPCPNGHELETPQSMVGNDAMCPHCEATFRLKYENSVEGKAERKRQLELKEEKWGRSALRWAIILASMAILGLLGLIVAKSLGGS